MRGKRFIAGIALLGIVFAALVGAPRRIAAADDVPTVSVADVTTVEGDAGTASIRVPVTLSEPSPTTTIKVPYTVVAAPDGATDGTDARLFKGTVTFLPGVVSKYVTVRSYGDTVPEPDQHVEVQLGTPIGNTATIDKGMGLVTLLDDDSDGIPPSTIQVSIGDVVIEEGDNGNRNAYMPVLLSSPATERTKVGFEVDCSAAALLDEASIKMNGTITFAIGTRSKYIPLAIKPDTAPEDIMRIFATITSKIASVKVLDNRGDAEINDDDGTLPVHPGYPVPNFAEESLPSGSTFNAQAVGDQEMIDQTPSGAPGTFVWSDPGTGGTGAGQTSLSLSHDGRYAAFVSPQTDLVPGDTNGMSDVFVRDRTTGTTERVSLREDGTEIQPGDFPNVGGQPFGGSGDASISADGRYVVYGTDAALDPADSTTAPDWTQYSDVYLYDRVLHTTELVSVDNAGNALHGSLSPSVSADGRYVLFNGGMSSPAVYVRDRTAGTTTLVYNDAFWAPDGLRLSANGRFAVIVSRGTGCFDQELVVVDLLDGSVERVDVTDTGDGAVMDNGFQSLIYVPVISGDGRFIAFKSNAWNLIPGMTGPNIGFPGAFDSSTVRVYVRDLVLKSTSMVSPGEVFFDEHLSMSDDGNLVAQSATVEGGPGVLYDRTAATTESVGFPYSWSHINTQLDPTSLSADGRYLGFVSPYYVIYGKVVLSDAWVQRVR